VDDYFSMIDNGVAQKLIRKDGSRFTIDGESFHGRDKLRKYLIANPKAFEALCDKTLDLVMAGSKPLDPNADMDDDAELLETAARELGDLENDDEGEDVTIGDDDLPAETEEVIAEEETAATA
jgi:hypothetical protein